MIPALSRTARALPILTILAVFPTFTSCGECDSSCNLSDEEVVDQFHRVWGGPFRNRWLGIPTMKNPFDVWITQEIIVETQPSFVVEVGTYHGGSSILWASILQHASLDGRVITIDSEDQRVPRARNHPLSKRVDFLLGDPIDHDVVERVTQQVQNRGALVILGFLQARDYVLAELRAYAPLVRPGGYLIVQNTIVNGHPIAPEHGPGPWEAVEAFLQENSHFEIDKSRERFRFTNNRNGYLKRIR